jgi:hypothetical protein
MPKPNDTELPEGATFNRLIPRKQYAAALGFHPRTAIRREQTDPDFPPVFYRNGRAFITDTGFETYKLAVIRRASKTGTYPANPPRCRHDPARSLAN